MKDKMNVKNKNIIYIKKPKFKKRKVLTRPDWIQIIFSIIGIIAGLIASYIWRKK